jgi:predicted nucleotidyltransferase
MINVSLLNSTGNEKVDKIIKGTIEIFEAVFPGRIRGYYLRGSYADGTAVSTSDIDMTILFKDRFRDDHEEKAARQICASLFLNGISPIWGDVVPHDEMELFTKDSTLTPQLGVKEGSVLIYGEDIRDKIPLPSMDAYIRRVMWRAFTFPCRRLRPNRDYWKYPLDYPDPRHIFYGYVGWDWATERSSIEALTSAVCALATAIIALECRQYVVTKSGCVRLYKECIDDEWARLLEEIYGVCRGQWEYRIPEKEKDVEFLRNICGRMLAFENHYFAIYRTYLLKELREASDDVKLQAVKRLGEIVYPDEEVVEALKALGICSNEGLQVAVKETIGRIQKAQI